jgi:triacylglycerol esterase/lipase EstA (alpha/beta hydrolase family)
MRRRITAVVAAIAAIALVVVAPTRNASAEVVPPAFLTGVVATFGHPDASPPGANDFNCQLSAAHPRPVVLVHGTGGNMSDNMGYLSANMKRAGYCVFALNYGGPPQFFGYVYGLGPIRNSAAELKDFVENRVLSTYAPGTQVDIIGHSQGGMMPRWYMKFLGGAAHVHALIGLSPSNHGSDFGGLVGLQSGSGGTPFDSYEGQYCQACVDQTAGSQFLTELNAGGDTLPGVEYTVIETMYDEIVTPYQSAFLDGPGVNNITLQNVCPLDFSEHLGTAFDPIALQLIFNALDPSTAVAPTCTLVLGFLTT